MQNMPDLFETEEYANGDNFIKQGLIKKYMVNQNKFAYADMIGQKVKILKVL